jgi:glutathione S-transferase
MASIFERLEEELDGKDFLAGEYSIADIAFTPNLSRLVDMGVDLPDRFPRLKAWIDRMMKRPNHRSIAEYGSRH